LFACRLEFQCTNNTVEYESLLQGMKKIVDLKAKKIKVFGYSKIVIRHVRNTIHCLSSHLKHYQHKVWELIQFFKEFNMSPIPRSLNCDIDLLANVASRLISSKGLMLDTFYVEILYRPSIPNNITNWRVFNDDQHIINFLHQKYTFKDSSIDEGKHDQLMNFDATNQTQPRNQPSPSNNIPKSVVRLDKLYDLQENFKRLTNCKTNSSLMHFEVVKLGRSATPQNINMGKNCSPNERQYFIKLFN
jgi:hypothetical protein